jgi:hypothetical protein
MSYLNLPAGIPNFSKAVISFWFRVPQQSLQDTWDIYNAETSRSRLFGIMPLLTFGEKFEGYKIGITPGSESSYTHTSWFTPGSSWAVLTSETITYNTGAVQSQGESFDCDPSFVGIEVRTETADDDTEVLKGYLKVYLQTASNGSPSNVSQNLRLSIGDRNTGAASGSALGTFLETHWDYLLDMCAMEDAAPNNPWVITRTPSEDISDLILQQYGPDAFDVATNIEVKPDVWHHVLISFDVSAATAVTGFRVWDEYGACPGRSSRWPVRTETQSTFENPSKIWIAFDDKHYEGDDLRPPVDAGGIRLELGPNDILSRNSITAAQSINGGSHDNAWDVTGSWVQQTFDSGPPATYSLEPVKLPAMGQPFGIPASADLAGKIHKVEMAEFQMWLDVTLDTYYTSKRRAFLAHPLGVEPKDLLDADGNPILDPSTAEPQRNSKGKPIIDSDTGRPVPDMDTAQPKKDPTGMAPVDPKKAASMMKKQPEILLHMSKNWKIGKNTGSYQDGVTVYDTDDPGSSSTFLPGKFEPTGDIKTWKPDPKVGETVGKTVDS